MGMQCLNGVLSLDGTLSTKKKELRTQFFIFACVGLLTSVLSLVSTLDRQLRAPIPLAGSLIIILGFSILRSVQCCAGFR